MNRKEFDLDLRFGETVEGALARLLCRLTVEVKADIVSDKTGNLCIEFEQWGPQGPNGACVSSGIAATTAMYWAFYWNDCCWLIVPTQRVKEVARRFYRDKSHVKVTGDNGNRSVLVPVGEFLPGKMKIVKKPAVAQDEPRDEDVSY